MSQGIIGFIGKVFTSGVYGATGYTFFKGVQSGAQMAAKQFVKHPDAAYYTAIAIPSTMAAGIALYGNQTPGLKTLLSYFPSVPGKEDQATFRMSGDDAHKLNDSKSHTVKLTGDHLVVEN